MRDCSKCGAARDNKHSSYCKACYNEYKRARYSRNREAEVERAKTYNKANYQRFLSNLYRYRKTEKGKETYKKWRSENKPLVRIYDANKRAKRSSAISGAVVTTEQWARIVAAHKGRCAYCGVPCESLTMDHVVPLSKGGSHSAENIAPACKSCNCKKHTKNAVDFMQKEFWRLL